MNKLVDIREEALDDLFKEPFVTMEITDEVKSYLRQRLEEKVNHILSIISKGDAIRITTLRTHLKNMGYRFCF
jgi:hypothetical protein